MIKDVSIEQFLEQLASGTPTPGGGAAAAIMGAMGAALISMVCNLTIGKPKFAAVEGEISALLERSEQLRAQLTAMIQDDVEVFDQVMAAYGLPKSNDEEKRVRTAAVQNALKNAAEGPLACARVCREVVSLAETAAAAGNPNLVSDAGVAALAAYAGLASAALNVYVNVSSIKEQAFAEAQNAELEALLQPALRAVQATETNVKTKLRRTT